jgi:hypothetical protein
MFTPRWDRPGITETMLQFVVFFRHTKTKPSDLTCALYASGVTCYGWVGLIFPLKCAGPGTKGFT